MCPTTDEGWGGGDSATFDGVTVFDGATYQLPDGQEVRAFVHVRDDPPLTPVSVTLHTAQEWATDELPRSTLDRAGRVMRQSWSAPARPTPWTAADLGPGDAPAWDAAVRRLGGAPWLPVDGIPAAGSPPGR